MLTNTDAGGLWVRVYDLLIIVHYDNYDEIPIPSGYQSIIGK